jgi:hypothetical protein
LEVKRPILISAGKEQEQEEDNTTRTTCARVIRTERKGRVKK